MSKNTLLKDGIKAALSWGEKNAPTVLTALGTVGFVTTVILAVDATPKAQTLLFELEDLKGDDANVFDKGKIVAECYWVPAVTGAASIACYITANRISVSRSLALAAGYSIVEKNFSEYKDKVTDILGERKEERVKDDLAKDRITNNPPLSSQVIFTGHGDTLCYDSFSGRYFKSSKEKIGQAINRVNARMMDETYVCLNDVYYELGLEEIEVGNMLGFNVNDTKLIGIDYSSQLVPDNAMIYPGEPCLVIDFRYAPVTNFHNWY